jgi:hypothetical protein
MYSGFEFQNCAYIGEKPNVATSRGGLVASRASHVLRRLCSLGSLRGVREDPLIFIIIQLTNFLNSDILCIAVLNFKTVHISVKNRM